MKTNIKINIEIDITIDVDVENPASNQNAVATVFTDENILYMIANANRRLKKTKVVNHNSQK